MLGSVSITQQAFDETFPQPKNRFTFIDAGPRLEAALKAAAEPFSDAKLHTGDAFATDYTKGFASFLNLLYVMLAFSVVVSLFGMVNTLVLSVFERTRELGHAAHDRDDPPPGAADDPPRERDHGADRRRARAPAGDLPRRRSSPRRCRSTTSGCRSRSPMLVAFTLVAVLAGIARGDHPRPPGLAARRARRAALRMTATATIPAAPPTRRAGRRRAHRPLGAPAPGGRPRARRRCTCSTSRSPGPTRRSSACSPSWRCPPRGWPPQPHLIRPTRLRARALRRPARARLRRRLARPARRQLRPRLARPDRRRDGARRARARRLRPSRRSPRRAGRRAGPGSAGAPPTAWAGSRSRPRSSCSSRSRSAPG